MTPQAAALAADHLDVAVMVARTAWPWDPDEAESIAMLALVEAAESFREGSGRFGGLLTTIVRRRLIDALRKETGRKDRGTYRPRPLSIHALIPVEDTAIPAQGWALVDEPGYMAVEDRDMLHRLTRRLQAAASGRPCMVNGQAA